MKVNKIPRRQETSNHKRRKGKKSDRSIDLTTHNKIFKEQKEVHDKNHHIPVNINTE
jgi:hypothetical protein